MKLKVGSSRPEFLPAPQPGSGGRGAPGSSRPTQIPNPIVYNGGGYGSGGGSSSPSTASPAGIPPFANLDLSGRKQILPLNFPPDPPLNDEFGRPLHPDAASIQNNPSDINIQQVISKYRRYQNLMPSEDNKDKKQEDVNTFPLFG